MNAKPRTVGITGVGSCMPEKVVSNTDLEAIVDTSDEWVRTRTGISERRRADENTATSDLSLIAARRALDDAGVAADEVDLIIVATVTPDMLFPATACILQSALGATRAAAFDLEAGCTGFIYALSVAQQFVATGYYNTVLVVGGETLSKIVNWTDRSTCILFGDGAGAVLVQPVEEGMGILGTLLGSDGSGQHLLTLPAGGSRLPASEITVKENLHSIQMQGSEVFKFAVRVIEEASRKVLDRCGLVLDDIDFLVPHQANIRIVEAALKRLNIPKSRAYINLDRYGNMSSASIPVALDEAVKGGCIKRGDTVLLVGFGSGLSWGSAVVRWT